MIISSHDKRVIDLVRAYGFTHTRYFYQEFPDHTATKRINGYGLITLKYIFYGNECEMIFDLSKERKTVRSPRILHMLSREIALATEVLAEIQKEECSPLLKAAKEVELMNGE